MGEHTIREILKRRSPETQRAMKRRRELAQGDGGSGLLPKLILLAVVLGILGYVGYLGWTAHSAGKDFAARKSARTQPLSLTGTTEFLPNTLLAAMDPAFYNPSGMSGSVLTRRLMRLYHPDASRLELRVMAVSVEAQYPKTDVMEAFINDAPLGPGVTGFKAASLAYFGKPFELLGPQDIALLVGLAQDGDIDPRARPDKAIDARNLVLQADLQQNVLGQAQVDALTKMPTDVVPAPAAQPSAPAPAPAATTHHPAH
jgi:membrane carboxypeptidase/penicillin-binding protein